MADTTCKVCMKKVLDSDDGLQCDSDCQTWFHIKCVGVTKSEYSQYSNNLNKKWYCQRVDCSTVNATPSQQLMNKMDELLNKFSLLATKDEVKCIAEGLNEIKADIHNLNDKMTSFEPRLDKLEGEVRDLKTRAASVATPVEGIVEEMNDRQRRSRNVIILGLKECASSSTATTKEYDGGQIKRILEYCGLGSSLSSVRYFRIGKTNNGRPRAIKLCLPSENEAITLFKLFDPKKCNDEALGGVSLARDRTLKERQYLSELRDSLKSRTESGELDLTIKYVNGVPKIVKKN